MARRRWFLIPTALALTWGRAHAEPAGYADARKAWLACFPDGSAVPTFPDAAISDDPRSQLAVTHAGKWLRVEHEWGGSGHEATYGGITIELDPKTCAALWKRDFTYDGAFATQVRVGWTKRGAPNSAELTELVATPARSDEPEFAMARAWLDHRCDGGWDSTLTWTSGKELAGPIAPAQPWRRGEPVKSTRSFWSLDQERAIGARRSLEIRDDNEQLLRGAGPELEGVIVAGLDAPTKTFTVGTIEIREAELPGRHVGRAIALYDRTNNRHRWVLLTRGCVQGTTIMWLGAIGMRAIGVTVSDGRYRHGDAIVVIDAAAGTAWAVTLPNAVTTGDVDLASAALAGTIITFGKGTATSAIDLAPALAELPRFH